MKIKGGFEKAKYYIESHSKGFPALGGAKAGPCITISREPGAGSDKISENLIEYFRNISLQGTLDWTVFDKNLIEKVIEDHNLPQKMSEYLLASKVSKITTMMNELFGVHPPLWTLVHRTSETILKLAQMGNVIIVGRAANIVTAKLDNAFHVRLISTMEDRIKHIQEHYELERKEAIDFIKKEDAARKEYVMTHFHRAVDDPQIYHMIINTHLIPYKEAAGMIGDAVVRRFPDRFPKV
jgi:hypothetical protein